MMLKGKRLANCKPLWNNIWRMKMKFQNISFRKINRTPALLESAGFPFVNHIKKKKKKKNQFEVFGQKVPQIGPQCGFSSFMKN